MRVGKDGWLELDPQTDMSAKARQAYEAMKDQYRQYAAMKAEYENVMVMEAAPVGKSLVFGYNFGKASIKVVDANGRKPKAAAKPQISLADYLAGQGAEGRAS